MIKNQSKIKNNIIFGSNSQFKEYINDNKILQDKCCTEYSSVE